MITANSEARDVSPVGTKTVCGGKDLWNEYAEPDVSESEGVQWVARYVKIYKWHLENEV